MYLILLVGVTVVLLSALQVNATVVYSEDFESGTDGQLLTAAPYNWTQQGLSGAGNQVQVRSGTTLTGLAVDGSTPTGTFVINYYDNFNLSPEAATWQVKQDVFATSGGDGTNNSGVGFHRTNGPGNVATLNYSTSTLGWFFDVTGLTGVANDRVPVASPAQGADKNTVASVTIDLVNNIATGAIFDGTNTYVASKAFPDGGEAGIDSIIYVTDLRTRPVGLDMDNVEVSEGADAPIPATFQKLHPSLAPGFGGPIAAWVDYNNDGYVDILSGWKLWRNDGGSSFTHVYDLPEGVWADFDNDGRLDLYSYAYNTVPANAYTYLYRNLSTPTTTSFTQVSMPAIPPDAHSRGASWADYDNDGYVDLYVGGYRTSGTTYDDAMVRNNQGTSFTSSSADYYNDNPARGVTSADFDRDGDQDVYVSNYSLVPNQLLLNDGSGSFTNVAGAYNAEATSPGFAGGHSIGAAWADFDNDGNFDLFAGNFAHPGQPESRFLRNRGPDFGYVFEDMGTGGVDWQESYASPAVGDYDNDGDLDLFFGTAPGYGDSSRLYRNNGNWSFEDVTASAGLGSLGEGYQAAWADFDNDGDLDLAGGARIWVNSGNSNHWLKVHLVAADGASVNGAAIGAEVRINVDGEILTRQVEGGTGEGNQNDPTLHFGFGSYNGPVDLEIRTPDGVLWDIINGVTLDQTVTYEISVVPTLRWAVDASGDWNTASNWAGAGTIPNSSVEHAVFGGVITAPRTVMTNAAVTVKNIQFDNANTYAIAGAGSVTLAADTGNASVDVLQGNHQFQAIVNLNSATDVDVAAGASLAFNNALNLGGNTLTKTGSGTMAINNALNTGGGSIVVSAGALGGSGEIVGDLTNNGGTVAPGNSAGTLTVAGNYSQTGGSLAIEIDGSAAGEFDVLEVLGNSNISSGTLDVAFAALPGKFGILDVTGTSSAAFASINNTGVLTVTFDGSLLASTGELTVLSALLGDMDGDLVVTTADVSLFIQALVDRSGYDANAFFVDADANGDVDGSGTFDLGDLALFSGLLGGPASAEAVPEPVSASLLAMALGALALIGYRRRK